MEKKQFILNLSCQDRVGIVAAVTGALAKMELFILELSQFSAPSTEQFFMRIFFETTVEIDTKTIYSNFENIANNFGMKWTMNDKSYRPKILLMVSKQGHCLNDLLNRWSNGSLHVDIAGIVSNHRDLEEIASWYKVPFNYLPINDVSKNEQENKTLKLIEKENIDLVVLARYMQILSNEFCSKLNGKIINIHHSFLPSFKGARPYHQAYDRGVKLIGATAHYVTPDLDEGPIIDQETIRVRHDHSANDLVRLGEDIESKTLARAVKWHIEQRVMINENKTVVFS